MHEHTRIPFGYEHALIPEMAETGDNEYYLSIIIANP
jgi:hypothetical protein